MKKKSTYDEVYVHTINLILLVFLSLLGLDKSTVLVDHNHSRGKKNKLSKAEWKFFLMRLKKIQVVSESLKKNYSDSIRNKIELISTFLPPSKLEVESAEIPEYISDFVADNEKTIVISGWRYVLENQVDLYGFDFSVEVVKAVIDMGFSVKMIVCIGDVSFNSSCIEKLKNKINDMSLAENIIIWEECRNSWALFSEDVVYFRPTSTDGDSISIHEAGFFGAAVVASDRAVRPQHAIVYEYGNIDSALSAIIPLVQEKKGV